MLARRRRTLGLALGVLLVSALAALQLRPAASEELLVGAGTPTAKAGAALEERFGQDPIVISVAGDLRQTLSPVGLSGLLPLEGKLAKLDGVQAVYGPATFINQTVLQSERVIDQQLGDVAASARTAEDKARQGALAAGKSARKADAAAVAARKKVLGEKSAEYSELLVRFGSVGAPALSNQAFVNTLVFGAGVEPKQRFRWLFPDAEHTLVLVRPKAGVEGDAMLALGREVQALASKAALPDAKLEVAGLPLLAAALERETRAEVFRLAPVAIGAMLLLLLVVLRRRRGRLISLAVALGALVVSLGVSWPLGLGLSVATVAALPVILGLGLDFAVQMQARYWLERSRGLAPAAAAEGARRALAPTLTLASAVMSVGFLMLVVSPVPLLDRLGIVLALGTVSAAAAALLVAPALLVTLDRGLVAPLALPAPRRLTRIALSPAVVILAVGLAVVGLAASGRVQMQSDLTALSPSGLPELKAVEAVQREIGTSGQISVAVAAADVTDPATIAWVDEFGQAAQKAEPRLRPGPNLADLVTGGVTGTEVTRRDVDGMLGLLPQYFLDAVLSKDRKLAELTYSIPFVPVAEQGTIVRRLEASFGEVPPGVRVTTTGLVVESAASARSLDASRPNLLLLAAAIVSLLLWLRWRSLSRVAVVLGPALLAAGLSGLVLAASGITLSPLGAALEPLVLAIGLEFGMLLDMSFRQARRGGDSPARARLVATRDIGGAVGLSAATVAIGFAVLATSRLPLLAQLGWLVALELLVCVAVALIVVPLAAEWRAMPAGPPRARPRLPLLYMLRPRRSAR
ncbi:MAG: MMPL family transporter [Solirubrobacterales bacterium]|nr:MMPL family transporter [Solirubrobacterales bacterium]